MRYWKIVQYNNKEYKTPNMIGSEDEHMLFDGPYYDFPEDIHKYGDHQVIRTLIPLKLVKIIYTEFEDDYNRYCCLKYYAYLVVKFTQYIKVRDIVEEKSDGLNIPDVESFNNIRMKDTIIRRFNGTYDGFDNYPTRYLEKSINSLQYKYENVLKEHGYMDKQNYYYKLTRIEKNYDTHRDPLLIVSVNPDIKIEPTKDDYLLTDDNMEQKMLDNSYLEKQLNDDELTDIHNQLNDRDDIGNFM